MADNHPDFKNLVTSIQAHDCEDAPRDSDKPRSTKEAMLLAMKNAGSRPSSITRDIEEEEKKGSHEAESDIPLKEQVTTRDTRDEQMEFMRKQRNDTYDGNKTGVAKVSMQKSIRSSSMDKVNQASLFARMFSCCAPSNVQD